MAVMGTLNPCQSTFILSIFMTLYVLKLDACQYINNEGVKWQIWVFKGPLSIYTTNSAFPR